MQTTLTNYWGKWEQGNAVIVGGGVKVAGGLFQWRTLTTSHANENDPVERGK